MGSIIYIGNNKPLSRRAVVLGILVLLLSACDKAAAPKPLPPEVTTVTVHAQTVPLTRESVGLLASSRIAQVRARVAGVILKRVYTEGTDVKQGQILFQIDPAPLEADLHIQQATLAKARADATNASLIAKRYRGLVAKGLLASQDLDTALANQLTTAAAIKAAQANVEKAKLDLGYATVTAPIAGYAGRALVTEGALVGQGEATQLTTIEQIDPVYVNFSQSVNDLQQMQTTAAKDSTTAAQNADNPVDVYLNDGAHYPHTGSLDFSDLAVDAPTGTVSLRAVIPNPERHLLPGMFVRLRVTMSQLKNAFVLPQASLLRDKKGAYVFVVNAAGKVEQRRVQTHKMTQTDWIVSGNLADGEQVILDGLQKVHPDGMVRVKTATTGSAKVSTKTPAAKH